MGKKGICGGMGDGVGDRCDDGGTKARIIHNRFNLTFRLSVCFAAEWNNDNNNNNEIQLTATAPPSWVMRSEEVQRNF